MTNQDIISAFPKLYDHPGLFDFSPPKAWLQVIWDLSVSLQAYNIRCVQVKSKFHGLRYYYDALDKDVDLVAVEVLIRNAEEAVRRIK